VPGIDECEFTDVDSRTWLFKEKESVVSAEFLDRSTSFPHPGVIACRIIGSKAGSDGREEVEVDTRGPWGIESVEDVSRFGIFSDQLSVPPEGLTATRH
jgi:hypothetical protein